MTENSFPSTSSDNNLNITSTVFPSINSMNQQPSTPITAATTSSSNYNNFNAVWSDQTIIVVVIFCSIALCIVCILSYIYIKNAIIKESEPFLIGSKMVVVKLILKLLSQMIIIITL